MSGVQIHGRTVLNNTDINEPDIDGGNADDLEIGTGTPAPGAFTTLKASTDPVDEHGVGDRGYYDLRYVPKNLDATTSTDPAVDAAVSTAIIDAYGGVIITLTAAGNSQTLQSPTDTASIKRFIVVTDDGNGANTIEVNGITMSAGEAQWFIWDGSAWVPVTAVDADDIAFTPTGDIVATSVQAAIAEVDTEKLAKANNLSDVADAPTSFANIKQAATETTTGVIEKATTAEAVTGTDTDRAVTPAGLSARMEAPGEIGGTTPAAGNFTDMEISGEMQADVDFAGKYTTGQQNISDLAAKGAGYWFDGVDDVINLGYEANLDITTNDFSVIFTLQPFSLDTNEYFTGKRQDGSNFLLFRILTSGGIIFQVVKGGVDKGNYSSPISVVSEDVINTISFVSDRDNVKGLFYNNGLALATTETTVMDTASLSNTGNFNLGGISGLSSYLNCSITRYLQFNLALTATEVKAFSSSAPIPFKYLGASQTEQITVQADRDFSGASNWTNSNFDTYDETDNLSLSWIVVSRYCYLNAIYGMVLGKRYRLKVTASNTVGTVKIEGYFSGIYYSANLVDGVNIFEFACEYANDKLAVRAISDTGSIDLDDFSLTQIGCVLQLEQPGIGHNQWLDTSGNELHGEVSGAIPTNLEANHLEKIIKKTVTGDSLWTDIIPAGYILERLICEETAGNAAILDMGTSDGTNDVFTGTTIAASDITVIEINKMFSSSAAQTLDINDDQAGSSWNSASIDITLVCGRIQL